MNIQGRDQTNKEFDVSKFIRLCEWCVTEFETEWETKSYCSRQHKEQARAFRKRMREGRVRPKRNLTCPVCQTDFITGNSQQVYCSTKCASWLREQRKREIQENRWSSRNTPLLKARIFYRDKGICQICNEPIDLTLEYPDMQSFSVDHIIPRSHGGNHALSNLQAAHLVCNIKRGNQPLNK